MANLSDYIPRALTAKTPDDLTRKLIALQSAQYGKLGIISIYWDGSQHVCWFYPISQPARVK